MSDQSKPEHDDVDFSFFLPPEEPPHLPRKGTELESLAHQPSNKKTKTLSCQEQSKINQQLEEGEKTLVDMESAIPQSNNGIEMPCRGLGLGKEVMNSEDDASDVDLLDDVDSDEDGSGYRFVDNDNDDYDETTSHRQQSYTILSEDDIRQRQEDDVIRISTVLSISRGSASILLRHHNWSVGNVHDAWFADEEKVRMTVGLLDKPVHSLDAKDLTCGICFEKYSLPEMYAAVCGHLFCTSCWQGYISTSIKDGPGCLMVRCPEPKCGAAVGQDMINLLVSDEDKARYSRYLLRSYIEDNRRIKWCPAPGCDYAVDFVVGSEGYDVSCKCTYNFCWNCLEDAHRPVDCDTVAKWILKNSAESENTNWILAYSKPCPKCKRPIEKNMGCMHMTCTAPCNFQFCWLCLGSWSAHFEKSGSIRSRCNGYKDGKQEGAGDETEKRREMAKKSLEKYTHYYERWANNQTSRQKAMGDLQKMQGVHIEKLSYKQCQSKTQLKFITDAWLQIIECRRVLKWTYAYGYYLPDHEHAKKEFFEYLQGEAESGLERLHQCAEQDLQKYIKADGPSNKFNDFRTKLAGLTAVTRNYFENLVQALENGLADVDSHGPCSKKGMSNGLLWGTKGKKSGRIKGTTSKPGGVKRGREGPVGSSWSCEHCTYSNVNSAATCHMCSQHSGSWSCGHCTYVNTRSTRNCQMCNLHR